MGRAGSQGRARPTGGPCVLPSSPSRDDWSDGCSDRELGGAVGRHSGGGGRTKASRSLGAALLPGQVGGDLG